MLDDDLPVQIASFAHFELAGFLFFHFFFHDSFKCDVPRCFFKLIHLSAPILSSAVHTLNFTEPQRA